METSIESAHVQRERRRSRSLEAMAVGALVSLAAGYWAACSVLIHRSFHSNGWDLGIINQMLWNSAHGKVFEYSFRDISYAGDHWQPFLLLLVPLKWLHTGPEALLIVQAVALAAAAIPLYGVTRTTGRRYAIALTVAYLLGLGAARAVSSDFHIEAFAPLFAFTALWGLARQQRVVFVAAALAILTLKEDGALLTLALCWIAWFAFGERRMAAGVSLAAVGYGLIVMTVIMPHFRGADLNPFVERYGYLGDSLPDVLWGAISRPDLVLPQLARAEAVQAVAIVLASAALLPLLAPRLLPPLAMVTLLPLLSKEPAQGSLDLHYLLVPSTVAIAIAAVVIRNRAWDEYRLRLRWRWAIGRFADGGRSVLPGTIMGMAALLWLLLSPLPPSLAVDWERFRVDHHSSVARGFVHEVPSSAIVSAQSPFVPHLSERTHIYQFPRVLDAEVVLLDYDGPIPAADLAAGYEDCLAALPRLGFDKVDYNDGISLWLKMRPAESVPEVPLYCSGQHPDLEDDGEELTSLSVTPP